MPATRVSAGPTAASVKAHMSPYSLLREAGMVPKASAPGPSEPATHASMAGVPHEFRTPLGALVTALEVIALADTDAATRTQASAVALRQARQLARLVDDLEDVLSAREGRLPLRQAELDFSELVVTARNAMVAAVPAEQYCDNIARGLRVRADPRLMRVCVEAVFRQGLAAIQGGSRLEVNLLAKEGGAFLRARTAEPDAGGGNDQTDPDALEPLTRLLACHVADLHGGYLTVRGGETALWVPLAPWSLPKAPRAPRQRSVLLCMRDRQGRLAALRGLRRAAEWTVTECSTPAEALALLLDTVPDMAMVGAHPFREAAAMAGQAREAGYAGTMIAIACRSLEPGAPLDEPAALRAGYDGLVVAEEWDAAALDALKLCR